jgi:hypothetical protein
MLLSSFSFDDAFYSLQHKFLAAAVVVEEEDAYNYYSRLLAVSFSYCSVATNFLV